MTIIRPPLLFILFNSIVIEAYPVLFFNSTQSLKKQDPSYAFLAKDVHLPEKFTLCSSIKQGRSDDVGFFTIHAQDSQEWLEMEFESFSKETKLTIRQGKDIHRIGKLPNPSLGYWKLVILYYGIINLITSYSYQRRKTSKTQYSICRLYKP